MRCDRLGVRKGQYVGMLKREWKRPEDVSAQCENELGYPMFVKPSNAGSSQGVSKANDRDELVKAIELAFVHDRRVLVEETIIGREIECAVLGADEVKASAVGEIVAGDEFYSYDAKYHNNESKTVIDPEMRDETKAKVRENAVRIFQAVDGFGLSRVDFFVEKDTEQVVFNEINTLPGFTSISMYPMLWENAGISKSELISKLIEMAYTR